VVKATGWSPLGGRIMRLPDVDGQGIAVRRPETEGKLIVNNGTVGVLPRQTDNGWRKVHAIRGKPEGKSSVLAVNSHTPRQGCQSLQSDQPRLESLPLGMAC